MRWRAVSLDLIKNEEDADSAGRLLVGWERAYLVSPLVAWTINLLVTMFIWNRLWVLVNPTVRGFVTFLAFCVVASITKSIVGEAAA